MSKETLEFLLGLLKQVQVSAADPNFEQAAAAVVKARKELEEALTDG